jgi:hypothetical protein
MPLYGWVRSFLAVWALFSTNLLTNLRRVRNVERLGCIDSNAWYDSETAFLGRESSSNFTQIEGELSMLVRRAFSFSVAVLLVAASSTVQAEQGLPSQSMLTDMGLASIVVMSDADAMAVRGRGYQPNYEEQHYGSKPSATAYGSSYASISGYGAHANTQDGFYSSGRHFAGGKHKSRAYIVVTTNGGGGHGGGGYGGGHGSSKSQPKPQVKKIVVFAGGYSYASSK